METRGKRQNYFALNDSYNNKALPKDQLSSPPPESLIPSTLTQLEYNAFLGIPDVEINPSESTSQSLSYLTTSTAIDSSIVSYTQHLLPIANKEAWFWAYFSKHEILPFQRIFSNILGVALPFTSRLSCKTIALSLDIWTSKNHLPILRIISYWLTESFDYRESVLEFKELLGPHSGENLAAAVEDVPLELDLQSKLTTITGDNASNNEKMVSILSQNLRQKLGVNPLFRGSESYVCCLAHILNLIVKDILKTLKSSNIEEAHVVSETFSKDLYPSFLDTLKSLTKAMSLAVPIYYKLHDLLDKASKRKERFLDLDKDISLAVKEAMKKYKKHYTFIDTSDIYYTTLILDPQIKGDLLLNKLEDKTTGREILQALRDNLHRDYSVATIELSLPTGQSLLEHNIKHSDVESQLLKRL
ncbi:conserved hypothetical protein [Talaromyces stipitatus ATCC 10500]|uniref:HAT C-terminal dimerisation domain-containing protein n=1 Tax=Talaromyces stipitatus (strain ATCC 10500 / CBS 375.48 / QM 6759 / NRRL 1006) TaxID=441959 RepID=B8MVJ2_TALSN|nr:uncharacterized protein TSTA_080330 [Talaromyces stipitatus ATCC 10500]EED11419.1 conserved hypothetical protein [Talaromyces stipitatus ATCC 10500]